MAKDRAPDPRPFFATWKDASASYLETLSDQVEVDLRHPAWSVLVSGVGLLEALVARRGERPEAAGLFRAANGGPDADTFMARPAPVVHTESRGAARWAILAARHALSTLEELDGGLPGQPLRSVVAVREGWSQVLPLLGLAARTVAFTTPRGAFAASIGEHSDRTLEEALIRLFESGVASPPLKPISASERQPTAASLAVAVGVVERSALRHLHRRCWSRGGGPWLGLAVTTDGLEAVSTSHVGTDGFGHGLICRDWFARMDADMRLGETRPRVYWLPSSASSLSRHGLAYEVLRHGSGHFAEQSYAFGRALDRFFGPALPEPSPAGARVPFQVTVAPGKAGDPERRRRRILTALLALRRSDGRLEGFEAYRERLDAWLELERGCRGPLTRLVDALSSAPMPQGLRRALLESKHRTRAFIPSIEGLAGRGRLSSIRFGPGKEPAAPLLAASIPPLEAFADDPAGSVTLTLIHHADGLTATVLGSGEAGSDAGAARFLGLWREELERS